ncbi:hypothetical protein OBBRIDRAFT_839323 [Obba rivulosa]|uniref:Uncharacterized protein n=1 Tax=Obba rivulosa TaxID=1052685 RepID=A0A8E2AI76_9APHY|nr:hypothetical protein OBBRIDRAFT_839323 [Obba rivulosa]
MHGLLGEAVRIMKRPEVVKEDLQLPKDEGYCSITIVFCHSYMFLEHERWVST